MRACSGPIALYLALQGPSSVGAAESPLRGNHPQHRSLPRAGRGGFEKLGRSGCTILEKVGLCEGEDGSTERCHTMDGKRQFACEDLETGYIYDIDNDVPELAGGAVASAASAFAFDDDDAKANLLESGRDVFVGEATVDRRTGKMSLIKGNFRKKKQSGGRGDWKVPDRRLEQTGERTVIAINAVSSGGTATTYSNAHLADSVFGSLVEGSDEVNLASQYSACSHNKLNFKPAPDQTASADSPVSDLVDGVVTVTSAASTSDGDGAMRNDVAGKLMVEYGFGRTGSEYVMVCLPPGTMSGIAYAYINHWLSVYSDKWCTYPSSQMHEVGHNLGLSHAGENGNEYDDRSGQMGYSFSLDEQKRCFSGPKMYKLGWFQDRHVELTAGGGFSGRLYGSTVYGTTVSSDKMIVRVHNPSCSTCDRYISFNHDFDFNSDTAEGQNQVLVHTKEATPTAYMNTYLVAKLSAGQSTSVTVGTGDNAIDVDIVVVAIDAAAGWAEVTIGDTSTPEPTPNPTNNPTPNPTNNPTPNPVTPSPTNNPTPNPTDVVPSPTKSPTNPPTPGSTPNPTESPTAGPTVFCTDDPNWENRKGMKCDYIGQARVESRCQQKGTGGVRAQVACPEQCHPSCQPASPPTLAPTISARPTLAPPPTNPPTVGPTTSATNPPTTSPTVDCTDDPNWENRKGMKCDYIGQARVETRCQQKGTGGVRAQVACPEQCNPGCQLAPPPTNPPTVGPTTSATNPPTTSPTVDCTDDLSWVNRRGENCDYIGASESRVESRCNHMGQDGVRAHVACPEQCNAACGGCCNW